MGQIKPKITAIVSFKNEAFTLAELYRRLSVTLEKCSGEFYEIIFVDDCSNDLSDEIIREITKNDEKVLGLRTTRSFGNAECLMAGIAHAKGEFIVYLDSDLQDPPELIEEMYYQIRKKKIDVIHTKRVKRLGESFLKMCVTKIGYKYLNKYGSVNFEEEVGDFKMISRRVADLMLKSQEHHPFPRGLINYLGFASETITYIRQPRFDGKENSKFPLFSKKWIDSHLDRTLISFSDAPLKMLFYIGLFIIGLSFLGILTSLLLFITNLSIPGWTSLVILISFAIGFQSLFLGVIGLYINAIFLQVKTRPLYVIDKIFYNGEIDLYEKFQN